MSRKTVKTATAAEARAWAREQGTYSGAFLSESARGLLPKQVHADFTAATGKVVAVKPRSVAPEKIDLKVSKVQKNGKRRSRTVSKSMREVRQVPGVPAKGVLSAASIALAEKHFSDPEPSEG